MVFLSLCIRSTPARKSSVGPDTKSSPSFGTASSGKGGDAGASNSSCLIGTRGDRGGKGGGNIDGGITKWCCCAFFVLSDKMSFFFLPRMPPRNLQNDANYCSKNGSDVWNKKGPVGSVASSCRD